MRKAKETNYIVLQEALLDLSEGDEAKSRELLKLAGADPEALIASSLKAIDGHRRAAETRLKRSGGELDLLHTVQDKIRAMFNKSPEKTASLLTSYFEQHSLQVQFGADAGLNARSLSKVKDKIDLNDLSQKLDDNNSD